MAHQPHGRRGRHDLATALPMLLQGETPDLRAFALEPGDAVGVARVEREALFALGPWRMAGQAALVAALPQHRATWRSVVELQALALPFPAGPRPAVTELIAEPGALLRRAGTCQRHVPLGSRWSRHHAANGRERTSSQARKVLPPHCTLVWMSHRRAMGAMSGGKVQLRVVDGLATGEQPGNRAGGQHEDSGREGRDAYAGSRQLGKKGAQQPCAPKGAAWEPSRQEGVPQAREAVQRRSPADEAAQARPSPGPPCVQLTMRTTLDPVGRRRQALGPFDHMHMRVLVRREERRIAVDLSQHQGAVPRPDGHVSDGVFICLPA